MTAHLPEPSRARWQPLRCGLVDLFHYDAQEFRFRDGRLLLRGNNGTGKSKVLALTLPFLLDGDLSPHRVEPDADPKKRMEWNLLLGGDHPHPERLGYTWLELGRIDADLGPQFRTLGCGLKAVSGRGITRHWFFLTGRRTGDDLALVDATGVALTRDRLVDALGDNGMVYDRARDYRRAVDETFFGFGEQRYGALVDLLVQLRQPQLSKRPSETALSNALTEALPPLDQAVVADVADAFRSLEEEREALTEMAEAHEATGTFLGRYRDYARVAARRRAAAPRNAQSEYERVRRELGAAETALAVARGRLEDADRRRAELADEQARLQARDQALRESPEMRSARELESVEKEARRLAGERRRAEHERDAAELAATDRRGRLAAANGRLERARADVADARREAAADALAARVTAPHADRVDLPLAALGAGSTAPPEPTGAHAPDLATVRRDAEALAQRQQRAIDHIRGLIEASEGAIRQVAQARGRVAELDGEAAGLAERRADAAGAVRERAAELLSDTRQHLEAARELRLDAPADALAALELWVEVIDGPNPAQAAATTAAQRVAEHITRVDAALVARRAEVEARLGEVDDEIHSLERGEDAAPPPPHTRGAGRDGRPGAPLWRLVDFVEDVAAPDRAGLEAALEAAGILDAWVTPAGEVLAPGTHDVVVCAGEPAATGLDRLLRPAVDRDDSAAAAVSDQTLARLLATISLGEDGPAWVTVEGRYGLGVLAGTWHKPVAVFIGRAARDAARRVRLEALRHERSAVTATLGEIDAERDRLAGRVAVLDRELSGLPTDARLRSAHAVVGALAQEHERLEARRTAAGDALRDAHVTADAAADALAEGGGDADLPTVRAELSEVDGALRRYRTTLAGLWPVVGVLREAARQAREAAADIEAADTTLRERAAWLLAATADASAARERHETLRSTVGAAVAELERLLANVADRLGENEAARGETDRDRDRAIRAEGEAAGRLEALDTELAGVTQVRSEAAESFRRFALTGLLAVALPELETPDPDVPWAPDPTVRLARRVNDDLSGVVDDDPAWDRTQRRLNDELKTLQDVISRHGNRASADLREDGVVVQIEFRGRPATVPELATALADEVAARKRLLDERERAILENHLLNEVASTLQELIGAAERQVAAMNAELESRPTSTGMRLRLLWRPRDDGPAGLAAARERLLRQTADAWSEDDRAAVGGFLQEQIQEVRARNAAGTWIEHLTEALDYRAWNRFVIQRHQNGQWRPATGPASGGERVLAASVPLFAAASAHYASATNPHAPRLVMLDEAFAGVDDNARAKYLGLLAAFDVDVVMTSEREWGCYPEVPGLSIAQLSRLDGVPAVLVTEWEWDGERRARVEPSLNVAEPVVTGDDRWHEDQLWTTQET